MAKDKKDKKDSKSKKADTKAKGGKKDKGGKGGKKGGHGCFFWPLIAILIAALAGAGYYFYENGNPFADKKETTTVKASFSASVKKETTPTKKKKTVEKKKATTKAKPKTKAKVQAEIKKEKEKFTQTKYKMYHQQRWGYKVVYPSYFTQEIHSENNDGCRFADYHGNEFITYGAWNATDLSIKKLYKMKMDDVKKVTYQRLFEKEKILCQVGLYQGRPHLLHEAVHRHPPERCPHRHLHSLLQTGIQEGHRPGHQKNLHQLPVFVGAGAPKKLLAIHKQTSDENHYHRTFVIL